MLLKGVDKGVHLTTVFRAHDSQARAAHSEKYRQIYNIRRTE